MSIREPPLNLCIVCLCSDAKVPSWTGAVDRAAPREQPTTQKSMFEQVQKNQMDDEEMKGKGENEGQSKMAKRRILGGGKKKM